MNYRHAYHAGNFADVLKHGVVAWIIRYLQQKQSPLALVDTHAGAGIYDLYAGDAQKTGEAKDGILRLAARADVPPPLAPYLEAVRKTNDGEIRLYPGSPLLMASLARRDDRVIACELHPEDGEALRRTASAHQNLRVVIGDGYRALAALVPPREKRGVVLIDPPFEEPDEFEQLSRAFIAAQRRWPTGIFVLWHPSKDAGEVERFHAELASAGIRRLTRVALDVARPPPGLSATGLVLSNAPYTFEAEWRASLDWLKDVLAQGQGATAALNVLTGDE